MLRHCAKNVSIVTSRVPWGWSTSLDLRRCNDKIKDKADIKDYVWQLCDLIEMKRFGQCHIERFGTGNKAGYSMLQLIETSNITGHFCDDNNSAYIDIFSCKPYDAKELAVFTKQFFQAESMVYHTTQRW